MIIKINEQIILIINVMHVSTIKIFDILRFVLPMLLKIPNSLVLSINLFLLKLKVKIKTKTIDPKIKTYDILFIKDKKLSFAEKCKALKSYHLFFYIFIIILIINRYNYRTCLIR